MKLKTLIKLPDGISPASQLEIDYPSEREQLITSFTPRIVEEILQNIKLGMSLADCDGLARLPEGTIQKWYNKNYCNFRVVANHSRALNKQTHIARVQKKEVKKTDNIRGSQWFLERKYKGEFGREVTVQVNTFVIDNVSRIIGEILIRKITDPDLLRDIKNEMIDGLRQAKLEEVPIAVEGEVLPE